MLTKFDAVNDTKIINLENNILQLSDKLDKLETKVDKLNKENKSLRNKLGEMYIDNIKEKETILSDIFTIQGFSERVALNDDKTALKPQELMNIFTKSTLKMDNQVKITNGMITNSTSKKTTWLPKN